MKRVKQVATIKWKSQEEIEQEKNAPKPPSTEERLEALELAVLEMVLGGGLNGSVSGGTGETGTNHD